MSILEQFWRGNLAPGEGRYRHDATYSESFRMEEEGEKYLNQTLAPEERKIFQKYVAARHKLADRDSCDNFIEGFRLGAKFMLEVLEEPE